MGLECYSLEFHTNGVPLTFGIKGCEQKSRCSYNKMMAFLKNKTINKAGFEQSVVDKSCNDVSLIHTEMKKKGIPLDQIGKARVDEHHEKMKAYKIATTGENAGTLTIEEKNNIIDDVKRSKHHKHGKDKKKEGNENEDSDPKEKSEK